MTYGDMNFHGGQQNFGNHNTNIQRNAAPADQVGALLTLIRDQHPDPAYAARAVEAVQADLADGTPAAHGRARTRLRQLADSAGSVRTVAETAAAVWAIVGAL